MRADHRPTAGVEQGVSSGVSRRLHCGIFGVALVLAAIHVSSGVSRRLHCGPQTVGEGVGAGTVSSGVSRRLHCGYQRARKYGLLPTGVLRCKPEAPLRGRYG